MEDVLQRQPVATAKKPKRLSSAELNDWIRTIDGLIGKQKLVIFEIGDLLIDGDSKLTKSDFRTIIKLSGLKSKTNAQNYMRVARKAILRKPDVFEKLPTGVGILIDLAAWEDFEIEWAVKHEIIKPQTTRAQLQKFDQRYLKSPAKIPPASTRVVGYIVCDAATYDFDRTEALWKKFDEIKLQFLDDDMSITPYETDVWGIERRDNLRKRVWAAYTQDPKLFVNPAFQKLIDRKKIDSWFCLPMKEIAPLIASADHKALHKIMKFSKSDWKLFGVTEVGYATLLAHFT